MKNDIFIIPEEVKSEFKFSKHIYGIDVLILVITYYLFDMFNKNVHPIFSIPYLILSILLAVIISRKSRINPNKRVITSLAFRLLKDQQCLEYYGIEEGGDINAEEI